MTTEEITEEIAKRISIEKTGSDAMWELCLPEAYSELFISPIQDKPTDKE